MQYKLQRRPGCGKMQMELSNNLQQSVLNISKEAFEKLVRKQHIDNLVPGPCVFDVEIWVRSH